jgi:hypothetical protein
MITFSNAVALENGVNLSKMASKNTAQYMYNYFNLCTIIYKISVSEIPVFLAFLPFLQKRR